MKSLLQMLAGLGAEPPLFEAETLVSDGKVAVHLTASKRRATLHAVIGKQGAELTLGGLSAGDLHTLSALCLHMAARMQKATTGEGA